VLRLVILQAATNKLLLQTKLGQSDLVYWVYMSLCHYRELQPPSPDTFPGL